MQSPGERYDGRLPRRRRSPNRSVVAIRKRYTRFVATIIMIAPL
jgi:hypothetical protein